MSKYILTIDGKDGLKNYSSFLNKINFYINIYKLNNIYLYNIIQWLLEKIK